MQIVKVFVDEYKRPITIQVDSKDPITLCRVTGRSANKLHGTSWTDEDENPMQHAVNHARWLGLTPVSGQSKTED